MIYDIENSDITKVSSGIVVHGCNAQGVMGSGVAKQLRAKYPSIFDDYRLAVIEHTDKGMDPLGYVVYSEITDKLVIVSAITQKFYGRDGTKYVSYDAMDSAMSKIASVARQANEVVHIPYLIGAGLGGGTAEIIIEIIRAHTKDLVVNFHHWK